MGKKYYCDYCDKLFPDNPTQRKRHIQGGFHQRMRRNHYDSMRDPSLILAEELNKPPCRNFLNKGHCDFDRNCRYSHLTEEENKRFQQQIEAAKESKKRKREDKEPTVDEWLTKRSASTEGSASAMVSDSATDATEDTEMCLPVFSIPACVQGMQNLPPSLLPPAPHAFQNCNGIQEWG